MSSFSEFLFGPPVTITTDLSREECSARCAELTLQGFFALAFSAFSGKPAMGEVSSHHLRWRKNSLLRDYFYQTELRASFTSVPGVAGTRIACEIGGGTLFWLSAIGMPCLMLVFLLFVTARKLLSNSIADAAATLSSSLIPLIILAGMLGFAVVFCRRDRVFLLDLLQQTVGGKMQTATENTSSSVAVTR
jgi:hypothetical protein